jgi:hypothetical protein
MLNIELKIMPVHLSEGDSLTITGVVENTGTSTIDTQIWQSKLLIDSAKVELWSLAIANGLRDEREFALPPGERVEFSRVLPASILPGSGRHELILEVQGIQSTPVTVELQ